MKPYIILFLILSSCKGQTNTKFINKAGSKIETRFKTPSGFTRKPLKSSSFGFYLRNLPLKPDGSKVHHYNGLEKSYDSYAAVIDMDISPRDIQQCADAVMRLRGEYLFKNGRYSDISFNLTNGFKMDYSNWRLGNRVSVTGNQTTWVRSAAPSNTHASFRKYMDFVFAYAGTISLSKTLNLKNINQLSVGDVFIKGGSPGHAIIVADLAEKTNGEKIFLLAQSFMPAQEIEILKNPNNPKLSPWYSSKMIGDLITPQYTFSQNQLKTW